MNEIYIAMFILGSLILVLGLLTNLAKSSYLSVPLLSMLLGVILGPALSGVVQGGGSAFLEQALRLTLAIGVMDIALRLPKFYMFHQIKSMALLLGFSMPLMWLASGLIFYLTGASFGVALLIGAVLTPTDPILAGSIISGRVEMKGIPSQLRSMLLAESGANDGLAYLFVFLSISLLTKPQAIVLNDFLTHIVLWDVVAAVVVGALIGYFAGKLLG
jgi:NhaP-type Na+/H+ or K+/H+ antiporter